MHYNVLVKCYGGARLSSHYSWNPQPVAFTNIEHSLNIILGHLDYYHSSRFQTSLRYFLAMKEKMSFNALVLLPLYIYPSAGARNLLYQMYVALLSSQTNFIVAELDFDCGRPFGHPDLDFTVIVNPNSGPTALSFIT